MLSFVLFIIIIFLFANIWFHLIESILSIIKGLFFRNKKNEVWHTLDEEKD